MGGLGLRRVNISETKKKIKQKVDRQQVNRKS